MVETSMNQQLVKKPTVKLEWIFGIRNDLLPNILVLDHDTIVYPAGHYIVIYNHAKKQQPKGYVQQFISGSKYSKGIVAMNVLSSTKKYIAIAEELVDGVSITFHNIYTSGMQINIPIKLQPLGPADIGLHKINHIAFSQREKSLPMYFAAIGDAETVKTIVIWKWEMECAKERLFDFTCPSIMNDPDCNKNLQLSFFLFMNYRFCVISNRFIYFYEITKKSITEIDRFMDKSFGDIISFSWFYEGNLVVATETHILIFNDLCKVIQKIYTVSENSQIRVICPVVDALVAGGTNGRIEIYEKKLDRYEKNSKSLRIYENEKEKSFDFLHIVNPNNTFAESIVFASTSKSDLIQISLKDLEKFNEKNHIKYLISAFHSDSVEGLDACINKPYLISCSKDKSIKLWDLQSKTLAINKFFEEGEMYSIAYHPSGMHAVVSFIDKIKPIHISYEEILPMINGINAKKSKEIKFSNGGQFFAFDSGNKIEVWDFLTMQLYQNLRYTFNTTSKVNAFSWKDDDQAFLVSGVESLYECKLKDTSPANKLHSKNNNFLSAAYFNNNNSILSSSDDNILKKINEKTNQPQSQNSFDANLKEILIMKKSKMMICATQNDPANKDTNKLTTTCLRVFTDITSPKWEYIDVPTHFRDTTRVRINYDENQIYTCGTDGTILIFSIETSYEGDDFDKMGDRFSERFTNVVLMKKTKIKEKETDKINLPKKYEDELKKQKQTNEDIKDKKQRDLEELRGALIKAKHTGTKIVDQKEGEFKNNIKEFQRDIDVLNNDKKNKYEEKKTKYQLELTDKQRKIEEIRENLKNTKQETKRELEELKINHAKTREEEEKRNLEEINKLDNLKTQLTEKIELRRKEKVLELNSVEWLNNKITEEMDKKIEKIKKGIDDLKVHYTHQSKKLKEKFDQQNTLLSTLKRDTKHQEEEKTIQENKKKELTEKENRHSEELKQIQQSISKVESGIIECKKKYQYLDKCKFVLDYKIKELKKEIGPIEKMIDELKRQTKKLDRKLKKFNREHDLINSQLVDFKDLKERIKLLTLEERKEERDIKTFKNIIYQMVNEIDDFDKLREGFRKLRSLFLNDYISDQQNMELEAEFLNQKENMRERVKYLKTKLKEIKVKHVQEIKTSRDDNTDLIKRINHLKQTINSEKKRKQDIAADIRHKNAIAAINAQRIMKNYENFEFSSNKEKIDYLLKLKEEKEKELKELEDSTSGNKVVYPTITNKSNNFNDTENSQIEDK